MYLKFLSLHVVTQCLNYFLFHCGTRLSLGFNFPSHILLSLINFTLLSPDWPLSCLMTRLPFRPLSEGLLTWLCMFPDFKCLWLYRLCILWTAPSTFY